MKYFFKIRQLTWAEFSTLIKAALVVFIIRLALKAMPYGKVLGKIEKSLRPLGAVNKSDGYEKQSVWAVRAVARHFLGDKPCLTQALALKWLLARVGRETDLKIGVNKNTGKELESHAWLELDGAIIIGGRNSPLFYTTLSSASRHSRD